MTTTAADWVPARSDLGLAAGYLLLGTMLHLAGMGGAGVNPLSSHAPASIWIPIAVVGCIGVAYRSKRLYFMLTFTGVALAATLIPGGSVFSLFFIFEMIFSAALFGTRRVARATLVIAVLLTAAVVVLSWVISAQWRVTLVFGLQAVLVFVVPLSWAGNIRKEKELVVSERERADAERENARHASEIAEMDLKMAVSAERSQMARDLHDVIAGHLSAMALQSEAAVSRDDPTLNRQVLGQVRTDSVTALEQMRVMIDLLHEESVPEPSLDHMAGGTNQLDSLAESARLSGSEVTVTVEPDAELPFLIDSTIFRIAQEALTNCTRHAPGQPVCVQVNSNPSPGGAARSVAEVEIINAMPDTDSSTSTASDVQRSGHGLRNMRLRTEQLGGTFTAGEQGGRWRVSASLPVSNRTGILS